MVKCQRTLKTMLFKVGCPNEEDEPCVALVLEGTTTSSSCDKKRGLNKVEKTS